MITEEPPIGRSTPQDQGWAWVVLGAAAFNLCVALGISLGSGVYVSEVIKNWDVNKADAALLGSVLYGIMFCFGPVASLLATKTSNRTMVMVGGLLSAVGMLVSANVKSMRALYFSFSVLGGIGNGMVFTQSVVMANLYFKKYRGIASGVTLGGGGIGLLVVPLLERTLIEKFSWQPSLYIVAGLCLNTCVAGSLFRPVTLPPKEITLKSLENFVYAKPGEGLLMNKTFVLFCVSSFIWGLGVTVPIILGPDFYNSSGINGFQINILLTCFGAGNLIGRLVGGVICNVRSWDKLAIYFIASITVGTNIGLFTIAQNFLLYAILASCFGISFGAFVVSHVVATVAILGPRDIEKAITASYFINGLALVIGPPLAGALYDLTNSYKWPFLVSACIMFLAAASVIPGFCLKKSRSSRSISSGGRKYDKTEKLSTSILTLQSKEGREYLMSNGHV